MHCTIFCENSPASLARASTTLVPTCPFPGREVSIHCLPVTYKDNGLLQTNLCGKRRVQSQWQNQHLLSTEDILFQLENKQIAGKEREDIDAMCLGWTYKSWDCSCRNLDVLQHFILAHWPRYRTLSQNIRNKLFVVTPP
ncbi:hypothetical protein FKM82_021619 [Ascaphus truei]